MDGQVRRRRYDTGKVDVEHDTLMGEGESPSFIHRFWSPVETVAAGVRRKGKKVERVRD